MAEQITAKQAAYLSDLLLKADEKWAQQREAVSVGTLGMWFSEAAWDKGFEGMEQGRKRMGILPVFITDAEAWRASLDVSTMTRDQASTAIEALKKYGSIAALYLALIPHFCLVGYPARLETRTEAQSAYLLSLIERMV